MDENDTTNDPLLGRPCIHCGEPYRPSHDPRVPGPTVGHVYTIKADGPEGT